jgi:hypothetical protein
MHSRRAFTCTPQTSNGSCGTIPPSSYGRAKQYRYGLVSRWCGAAVILRAAQSCWAEGADGRGVICAGDILTVTTDRKWLSFMRSYPNFIPLSARAVNKIGAALKPFAFDAIYGHYFDRVIAEDGKAVLEASLARYVAAVEGKRGYE